MNADHLIVYLRIHELDLIVAAVIAIVGLLLSQYMKKLMLSLISHKAGDHTVKYFIINLCYIFALSIIAIMVLNKLGVPTTSLIAVLGASSLAIALSIKDSLSNVAAGVLLIFQKPFKIGDSVTIDSVLGTVKLLNIYNTIVVTTENDYVCFPNSKVINQKIINHSSFHKRKVLLPIYVSYKEDLSRVRGCLLEMLAGINKQAKETDYGVTVSSLDTTGVLLNVIYWVKTPDYTAFRPQLLEKIKLTFEQQQIHFATLNATEY